MRLSLQFVWSLNDWNQTREEEWMKKFIFKEIRENWFTLSKTSWNFCDDQFFANASQHFYVVFLVCFTMMQVMLSISLLFIEFFGSCSRWRVTNDLVPCVLGPTSFYLKIWVKILNIWMLLCSWGYIRMLLRSWWSSSGFIIYECIWVYGFIICMSDEFQGIIHE